MSAYNYFTTVDEEKIKEGMEKLCEALP